jgi:ABC-type transport system involved in multi-copper enzyme maturation permease subunit
MHAVLSIATTAFRESIRNRTLLGILLLAVGFTLSALLLVELALDQRTRVILDWGLFCVSAFGVVLAILMGVNQVHKEIRRKNLYVVLSRPLHRWQYVLGKYLGLALTLLVEVGALSVALIALLAIEGIAPGQPLAQALLVALVEILLVAGIAVFFASFSTPALSGLFTLGIFVVGRSLPVLDRLADKTHNVLASGVLKTLVWGLPDLADFNLSNRVVHDLPIAWAQVGWTSAYGLGYLALLLVLAAWIFTRRDLT